MQFGNNIWDWNPKSHDIKPQLETYSWKRDGDLDKFKCGLKSVLFLKEKTEPFLKFSSMNQFSDRARKESR